MFNNLSSVMLSWFVDADTAKSAVHNGCTITADKIKRRIGTSAALDDSVSLFVIRKHCDTAAWAVLQSVVEEVKCDTVWYCGVCTEEINDEDQKSIACDSCLQWTHFKCVGLKTAPKGRCWFCSACKRV